MMDWENSSSIEDDAGDIWNIHKAVSNIHETESSSSRASIRGLQIALVEGWLVQRARDMCSFSHDRYRQAAQAEAENLPKETIARMSFRVRVVCSGIYFLISMLCRSSS
jgi:hypothetical protein